MIPGYTAIGHASLVGRHIVLYYFAISIQYPVPATWTSCVCCHIRA